MFFTQCILLTFIHFFNDIHYFQLIFTFCQTNHHLLSLIHFFSFLSFLNSYYQILCLYFFTTFSIFFLLPISFSLIQILIQMKTSYISDTNHYNSSVYVKLQSSKDQKTSRSNSKQAHNNPLKMKNSFLRQSLTMNNNQPNLIINIENSILKKSPKSGLTIQSERKQDLMMKKISEKFSVNQISLNYQQNQIQKTFNSSQKEKQIIRLSGRKHDNLFHPNYQKYQEKENNNYLPKYTQVKINNKLEKNIGESFVQKSQSLSKRSTSQSLIYDNSLTQFAQNAQRSSFVTGVNQNVEKQNIETKLQLILKRLARNECDIEKVKRDRSMQGQFQGFWKLISQNQNRIQTIEKRLNRYEEKQSRNEKEWKCMIEQNEKLNSLKSIQEYWKNRMQQNEKKQQILQITLEQLKINEESKGLQIQKKTSVQVQVNKFIEGMKDALHKIALQNQQKLKLRFNEFDRLKKQIQSFKETSHNNLLSTQKLNFKLSHKKQHQFIKIIYKELATVSNTKREKPSSFSSQMHFNTASTHSVSNDNLNSLPKISQNIYFSSDRSKLLANAFNNQNNQKKQHVSLPVSPLNYQYPTVNSQVANNKQVFSDNFIDKELITQLEINQVQYFIDKQGYLLDQNGFYIINQKEENIKLDEKMIQLLRSKSLLKE